VRILRNLCAREPRAACSGSGASALRYRGSLCGLIKRSYKLLLECAGLPQIPFHCLRHTFATLMMFNGHPKVVQEMLRHSQVSTTLDIYSHVSPGMQDEAVKRFGSLFS